MDLATKSILKNITITNKRAGFRLASALERSRKTAKPIPADIRKRVDVVTDPDTIRKMFEN